jgi:high-affinity Fe2+/Pb2+ permease
MAPGTSSTIDAGRRQERKSMYIGIGTVVLIVIIVLVVLMLRRRLYRYRPDTPTNASAA